MGIHEFKEKKKSHKPVRQPDKEKEGRASLKIEKDRKYFLRGGRGRYPARGRAHRRGEKKRRRTCPFDHGGGGVFPYSILVRRGKKRWGECIEPQKFGGREEFIVLLSSLDPSFSRKRRNRI